MRRFSLGRLDRLDRPGPHGRATDVTTLGGALRRFVSHPRPPVLLGAVGGLAAVRAFKGTPGRADAKVTLACVLAQPFVEWAVHRHVLHVRPDGPLGRLAWEAAGWGHAQHHADPASMDTMFLRPQEVVRGGALAVAAALLGSPATATGLLCAGTGFLAYDWTHFLIHTGYRPRSALYRRAWRNHRLHHYRNERYWLGVTSPVADLLLRTEPARDAVPVSRLATRPQAA